MGDGLGVEVRPNSIRLIFTIDKQPVRKTLKINGEPMPPTPANIKFARRLAAEIRDKIRHGTFSVAEYFPDDGTVGQGLTVGRQLDAWLSTQRVSASTRKAYESAIRFWKASLADHPVRTLKLSNVLKPIAAAEISGKTANNYISVLRKSMQLAVDDGVISGNPVGKVPKQSHQAPEVDPFTEDEMAAILRELEHEPMVRDYVEFKSWTGLRTGESIALCWDSVPFQSKLIVVDRSMVRGVLETTKTDKARNVRLNSLALACLQRQRERCPEGQPVVWLDPRYMLPWADERAFRRSYWAPALKRAGVRYRVPYTTRHTYATRMLMAGMAPAFCARQMGHSVEVFLKVYTRWIDGARDSREMDLLEKSISELPR